MYRTFYNNKVKTVNLIIIIADEEQENMQARAFAKEKEAADNVQAQPRKTRCCRKCGQPMKGHPRSQCPQQSTDDHS